GTALTEKHLELVTKAGARELVFVFDGDAAGLRAAQRASEIAAAQAVAARVLVPPGGEDPDETVLRVGIQGFRTCSPPLNPRSSSCSTGHWGGCRKVRLWSRVCAPSMQSG